MKIELYKLVKDEDVKITSWEAVVPPDRNEAIRVSGIPEVFVVNRREWFVGGNDEVTLRLHVTGYPD